MRTDNSTANGILNKTFQQNRSKAIDMRFYWLVDRAAQGQFRIYWDRGNTNLSDYFTKHHPGLHHRRVRPIYIKTKYSPMSLQGCIELLSHRTKEVPKSSAHYGVIPAVGNNAKINIMPTAASAAA